MGDGKNGWGWGGGYFKGAGFLTPVWRPGFLPSIKGAAFFYQDTLLLKVSKITFSLQFWRL